MNASTIRDLADDVVAARWALLTAVLAGAAGTAGSYVIAGATPGFVAAPISGFLARTLPGEVLTLAIVFLGSAGQQLNLLTAVGIAVVGFAVLAGLGTLLGRRVDEPGGGALVGGVASGLAAFALTGAALPAIGAAVGVAVVSGLAAIHPEAGPGTPDADRRGALRALAGVVAIVGLGAGVRASELLASGSDDEGGGTGAQRTPSSDDGVEPMAGTPPAVERLLDRADEQSLDVEGMDPLVSEDFYEVDISTVNPDVDAAEWTLRFTGAVAEESAIDFGTLTAKESEHRLETLRCVGERLNGHKMDNAVWTGVPIAPLLEDLEIRSDCECVMLRAVDDYYEEFPLAALERGFLAWGMNGGPLPRRHGYPVRALIPGHWGEINVKWLTEMEFLERETDGFWEERGWHGTGPVNTVAKIHAVNRLGDGRIQVGGHTYAGTRGIERVEVSTDGGSAWTEATLSAPLPGEDVWRQWVLEYDSPGEAHEVVARAVDGTGTRQPREESGAFPSGPTGWVRRTVDG